MPKRTDIQKILIIGSGPIVIGQACEFDYSGRRPARPFAKRDIEVVLVNSNPATIMTDPEMADRTYIEPLTSNQLQQLSAERTTRCAVAHRGWPDRVESCTSSV